jgi:hypothetical protein
MYLLECKSYLHSNEHILSVIKIQLHYMFCITDSKKENMNILLFF